MKTLDELLQGVDVLSCQGDLTVTVGGVAFSAGDVRPGDCFVAVKGFVRDGIDFLPEAVSRGAVAVVTTHAPRPEAGLTWVQVKNDRKVLSRLAARLYDNASLRLPVIGVTGTNGKTTTVGLIEAILNRGGKAGRIGTLGMSCGGREWKTTLTTPEAPQLYEFMAEAEKAGCRTIVMEVSSASLELHRVADIRFAQAIFTSFSGDHLDFHKTMENYFEAKLSLFKSLSPESWAVLNMDDAKAPEIIRELNCKYVSYGFSEAADVRPLKHRFSFDGIQALLQTPRGRVTIDTPLLGRVNLLNVMAAVCSTLIAGVAPEEISAALRQVRPIRGRLDVAYKGDFLAVVDYAHTDDAMENLLRSLREITTGRLILVFGAGGSRDRSKRPRMARVAAQAADYTIVTSDNPRQEEPAEIIAEIVAGFPTGFSAFETEVDRAAAIAKAVQRAEAGDIVVLAGKGHEEYQIFRDRTIHFSDFEVVQEAIRSRACRS